MALSFSPNPHQSPQGTEGPLTSKAFHPWYHVATQGREKQVWGGHTISLPGYWHLTYILVAQEKQITLGSSLGQLFKAPTMCQNS